MQSNGPHFKFVYISVGHILRHFVDHVYYILLLSVKSNIVRLVSVMSIFSMSMSFNSILDVLSVVDLACIHSLEC